MSDPADIKSVREYFTRLGIPAIAVAPGVRITPKMIGGTYDWHLAQVECKDAPPLQFMNYGFWDGGINDRRRAQENLIERLVAGLPNRDGRVLDAACGTGAGAQYLTRYWRPSSVFGINISANQLDICLRHSSCRNVAVMDAGVMPFGDGSFQNVICVEAAFHFDTREKFLRECVRILSEGGTLALTDLLLHEEGHELLPTCTGSNYVSSLSNYESLFRSVGFSQVEVADITEEGWNSYARHVIADFYDDWLSGRIGFAALQTNLARIYRLVVAQKYNLMCFAKK